MLLANTIFDFIIAETSRIDWW